MLKDKGIYKKPLFKLRKEEGSFVKLNIAMLLLAQTEASKQDTLNKDLQLLNRYLLLKKPI
jgi:hypothetical protein